MSTPQNAVPLNARSKAEVDAADKTEKYILDQLNDYDRDLWKNRAYRPFKGSLPVDFPDFTQISNEVTRLQTRLKAQANANGGKLDLQASGRISKAGMLFAKPTGPTTGNPAKDISAADVNSTLSEDLLTPYFEQGQQSRARTTTKLGISHDTPDPSQDYWLPGLFLIDEIFEALLNETWNKCFAFNDCGGSTGAAQQDLDSFVNAISFNQNGANTDADKYLPFINYADGSPTYIKLIKSQDGLVVGALVHVGDWAAGSHSSGSGIP